MVAIYIIFNDTQNVHNNSIQKSIKESIQNLLNLDTSKYKLNYLEYDDIDSDTKRALVEYSNDQSIHSILNVTFEEILKQVLFCISTFDSPIQIDIKNRLKEEMLDADCKCFTGRINRLINTLSGYTNLVKITIS